MNEVEPSGEKALPQKGDVFVWTLNAGSLIEVLSIGRKYAQIRVTQPGGATWTKAQPLPFPPSFQRVSRAILPSRPGASA